jgi:hypothetical protein
MIQVLLTRIPTSPITAGLWRSERAPADPEVAQSAPDLIDRFGQVAAQLRGQPGDQYCVLVVGLVGGQVLVLAGTGSQHRLHTVERHAPLAGQLAQHPPAMAGGFTRHRDPGIAGAGAALTSPVQRRTEIPGLALERSARSILTIAFVTGTAARSLLSRAFLLRSPRETP